MARGEPTSTIVPDDDWLRERARLLLCWLGLDDTDAAKTATALGILKSVRATTAERCLDLVSWHSGSLDTFAAVRRECGLPKP